MKTLANCSPAELAAQMCKISGRLKKYIDGIGNAGKVTVKDDDGNEITKTDVWAVIDYICGENFHETMALCGDMCFMSPEEFAALDPEKGEPDGIVEVLDILNTPRVLTFFTTSLRLKNFFAGL